MWLCVYLRREAILASLTAASLQLVLSGPKPFDRRCGGTLGDETFMVMARVAAHRGDDH